ncbi:MAG: SDR family oxidoreductase [Bacteroidales bacterium]|nr:SDR family oxidoreductase [Bacteroidales bacterium]
MDKQTTLITGASSGIGKDLAYVFAEKNYDLVLVARRKENLENIKSEIEEKTKGKVEIISMDLAGVKSAELLYDEIKKKNINIDVLINNAGFGVYGDFIEKNITGDEGMVLLNIMTLTKLTKLFGKDMKDKGEGNIINIASTGAFQAVPGIAIYAASKAYVLSFSEAIAHELKKHNVFVTAICPGPTKTEFADVAKMSKNPFKNAPTARELAEFTYKSMIKRKVCAIHGFKNSLLVFFVRLSPRKLITAIAEKVMK